MIFVESQDIVEVAAHPTMGPILDGKTDTWNFRQSLRQETPLQSAGCLHLQINLLVSLFEALMHRVDLRRLFGEPTLHLLHTKQTFDLCNQLTWNEWSEEISIRSGFQAS